MTLNQALSSINSRRGKSVAATYYLACGFEPLHLATFFRAELMAVTPGDGNVEVRHGAYGDLCGNLSLAADSEANGAAVALEWVDFDPRLGLRASSGWSQAVKADILANCPMSLARLESALERLAGVMPVALTPPHLPLPPLGNTVGGQSSVFELELQSLLAAFLLRMSSVPGLRVVRGVLPETGTSCLDARMELRAGFPYTVSFASVVAKALVDVLCQPAPKKGLITDLDNTFWAGIVGEIGAAEVTWSQESHTQQYGLYQQMLSHLASCGVLLAACSKNEQSTAEAALARKDLLIDRQALFPVCANWGPKSASVARILEAWNIGPDAVVFVDDSPMELEEVRQAYPSMTCIPFPGKDPTAVWNLLGELRTLFGKPVLTDEDGLRQASIRASVEIREMGEESASPEFLGTLRGSVTLTWNPAASDKRPLELINKTNQFNLNGVRVGEREWLDLLNDRNSVVAVLSYEDKFGPLGKIGVVSGQMQGSTLRVAHWVMSCRAFSRRIEHHTLDALFTESNAEQIEFAFAATEKNQPLQKFLQTLDLVADGQGAIRLSKSVFRDRCGSLPHNVATLRE